MGTEGHRRVQVFSSEIVEDARMLLTQNPFRNPLRS
jgi:hypothetical protein